MEARLNINDVPHDYFIDQQSISKQIVAEITHEISDLRKDLKNDIAQLRIMHDSDIKSSCKELEMRMYQFITKAVISAIGILSGLQSFFHFVK